MKLRFVMSMIVSLAFLVNNPVAQVLDLPEIIQEKDQWCWAAVSCAVLGYFGQPLPQCEIAEYARVRADWYDFGPVNCCDDPDQGCNYWNYNYGSPGSIQDILQHWGVANYGRSQAMTALQLQTEIRAGRPCIIRWEWSDGGGHFIVGHGLDGTTMYYLNPWFGEGLKIAEFDWVLAGGDHIWTHTNYMSVPSAPTLIAPQDAATGLSQPVTVSWNPVSQAQHYRVQVATDPAFYAVLIDESIAELSLSMQEPDAAGTTLYWRVQATGTTGTGAWSAVRRFTTTDETGISLRASPESAHTFSIGTFAVDCRLSAPTPVQIRVFTLQGRLLATLADEWMQAGSHRVAIRIPGIRHGLCVIDCSTGERTVQRRLVHLQTGR